MIKAVFFDCDGTLLSHATNRVPDSTVRAFAQLKEKGIRRILSTGRHASELDLLPQLKVLEFDGCITVNGACSYDASGVLASFPIDKEVVDQVYEYVRNHDLPVEFFFEKDCFISSVNDTVIKAQGLIHTPVPPLGDLARIKTEPVYLMVPFGIEEAQPLVRQLNNVAVTNWNTTDAVDVVSPLAGKGSGVRAFCDAYGITKEETMAFGDAMNDLPMLKEAGIAVVMGNGVPELKVHADYVTDDIDEDGVYHALVHLGVLEGEETC